MNISTANTRKRNVLFSGLLFLAVLVLTQYLAYQQCILTKDRENTVLLNELVNASDRFKNIIDADVNKANTLAILYDEIGMDKDFEDISKRILETNATIDRIELVHNYRITHTYPLKGNEKMLGMNTVQTDDQREEYQKAIARKGIYISGPRKLNQGGYGIVAKVPFYKDNELKAFCILLTNLSTLKKALHTTNSRNSIFHYVLAKKDNSGRYHDFRLTDNLPNKFTPVKSVEIPEGDWKLEVSYSDNFEHNNSYYLISVFGLILSLLSGWAFYRRAHEKTNLKLGIQEKTHLLNERVKELSVIYEVNKFLTNKSLSIEQILTNISRILPNGWRFPEKASAKIVLEQQEFVSEKSKESKDCQSADFKLIDGQKGSVEICYFEKGISNEANLFLPEETRLIKNIAQKIENHLNQIIQAKAIDHSEKQFRGAFEMASVGMAIVSPEGNWVKVNKAICEMLGYTEAELVNINFKQITHPDDLKQNQYFYDQILLKESNITNVEKRYLHKNGSVIWANLNVAVIKDEYDMPLYSVIHVEDITEKKKFYDELQKSEANMSSIFEATEVSYLFTDKDLNVVASNTHFNKLMLERSRQKFYVGGNYFDQMGRIPEAIQLRIKDMFLKVLEEKKSIEYEERAADLDNVNAFKYYQFTISPVINNEEAIGICMAVINITERKNLELENQKIITNIIQRNRDLEQFSYILSHNIRIPISNLLGLIKMLDHEISEEDQAFIVESFKESVAALDDIVTDVNHTLSLRENILEAKTNVSLKTVLNNVQTELSESIRKTNAKITCDFDEIESFYSISPYIHSVFLNLISNSLKFTAPERTPEIKIWTEKNAENILIHFEDNGAGIDMDRNGNKIFGLYKKFDIERAGKGMGLFLAKAQINALNGNITVKSELGKGTLFSISLPI